MKRTLSFLLVAAGFFAGCVNAPETGRSQLHLVPDQLVTQQSGLAFQQMKQGAKVSSNSTQNEQVRRVGTRIVNAARQSGAVLPPIEQWEFVVFDDDKTVNAFAMPGGKIGVYSGMFPVAPTDADLAIVLGHEVAHVSAGHGSERMSQAVLAGLIGAGVNEGLSQSKLSAEQQKIYMSVFSAGATLGVLLPYSRTQESEADHIGLLYAARAGYDPHVAVAFWQRMAAQSAAAGGGPPTFLSDHPSDATRIQALQEEMPKASAEYQQALANGVH